MVVCRDESGGSDVDGRAAYDLRSWLAAGKTEWRLAFRAQIIWHWPTG